MKFNELRLEMTKAYSLAMDCFSNNDYENAYSNMMKASKLAKEISKICTLIEDIKEYENLSSHYYKKALDYHSFLDGDKKDVYAIEMPTNGFDDFIGLDKEKEYLKEEIINPWENNTFYQRNKNALLIYGPHGVGKTRFAHSIMKELHAKTYFIQPLKHFGMTDFPDVEFSFNNLFDQIEKENNIVLFIESPVPYFSNGTDDFSKDICSLFIRLFKNELKKIKRKKLNVLLIATTSSPDKMNDKVFTNGLFDDFIRLHLPNENIRLGLVNRYFGDKLTNDEKKYIVEKTSGFVNSDISRFCKEILESNSFDLGNITSHLSTFKVENNDGYESNVDSFESKIKDFLR